MPAFVSNSGGIDQEVAFAILLVRDVDRIACCSRDLADDCAWIFQDRVDQRRFANIRPADDRKLDLCGMLGLRLSGRLLRRQMRFDAIDQFRDSPAVRGANRDEFLKAERRKFDIGQFLFRMVDLVHGKNYRFACRTQFFCQRAISWRHPILRISHKDDDVGHFGCDPGFRSHLLLGIVPGKGRNSSCIYKSEGARADPGIGDEAVAGYARLVVDDSDPFPCKPVEQSGLSNVRAADDCYDWQVTGVHSRRSSGSNSKLLSVDLGVYLDRELRREWLKNRE